VFAIDYVVSCERAAPVERDIRRQRFVSAAATARTVLHDIIADRARGALPVIGYLIRDESGTVGRRLYKGVA